MVPSLSISTDALVFVNQIYWVQAEEEMPKGWTVRSSGRDRMAAGGWVYWAAKVSKTPQFSRARCPPPNIST